MTDIALAAATTKEKTGKRINWKQYLTYPNVILGLGWIICVAIGALPSMESLLSLALLGLAVLLIRRDEFYIFLMFFIFFLDQFNLSSGSPAYRIYSYLVLIKFIVEIPKAKFRVPYLPAFLVFFLFCIFGVGSVGGIRLGLHLFADIFIVYAILIRLKADPPMFRKMVFLFGAVAVAAGIYSMLAGNIISYDVGREGVRSEEIVRYCATFGDANYAGFYYNIAIFGLLSLKAPKWYLRLPLVLALHYFLLLTNSMTAFLAYFLCLALFLLLRFPKKAVVIFPVAAVVAIIVVALVMAVPALQQIDFIQNVIIRVSEQFRYLQSGRLDMFTSGRTDIWDYFMDCFRNQDILGKLFGGNVVTSAITGPEFTKYLACHQAYIQGLLTFGVFGAIVVFATVIGKFIYKFVTYFTTHIKGENADIVRVVLIATMVWLFFGFSIDFFLDWRFMYFFFI